MQQHHTAPVSSWLRFRDVSVRLHGKLFLRGLDWSAAPGEQWAVLGPYDFVNIVEAPDEKVIARVSMELAARGTAHFQTLTAIPVDEFLSLLK